MAALNVLPLSILLLSSLCISISAGSSNGRKILNLVTRLDDSIYPPPTNLPSTTPITNPANFPPYTPTPTIVTVPASNPTTSTPVNPMTTPTTTVPTSTTPMPITNPAAPVSNPATTYPTPTPTPTPTTTTPTPTPPGSSAPVTAGQTWCIARSGLSESSLQPALDYACGNGGADCSTIQQGGSCYNPNTMENHASVAFNSYFQKNPVSTSCDFGGTAVLVNTNPSSGSCIYPSSASGTAAGTPSSTLPPATTSSTDGATGSPSGGTNGSPYEVPAAGSYGSPPSLMNSSYPASGFPVSYGPDSPPTGNSLPAGSATLQPCIAFIILVASFSTGKLLFSS